MSSGPQPGDGGGAGDPGDRSLAALFIQLPRNWRQRWWALRLSDINVRTGALIGTLVSTVVLAFSAGVNALLQSPLAAITFAVELATDAAVAIIDGLATAVIGPLLVSAGVSAEATVAFEIASFVVGIGIVGTGAFATAWLLGWFREALI